MGVCSWWRKRVGTQAEEPVGKPKVSLRGSGACALKYDDDEVLLWSIMKYVYDDDELWAMSYSSFKMPGLKVLM